MTELNHDRAAPPGTRRSDPVAFFAAVHEPSADRVREILTADPALVTTRSEGGTALHFAAIANDKPMVEILLRAGADVNARDDTYQMTPIGWANEEGYGTMVQFLYERGADVDLHQAASYGLLSRVGEFVKGPRRQVNALVGGWTALHLATLWGHPAVVELLLSRGGDPLMRDPFGRTTLEIARAQIESGGKSTPIVREERRLEIVEGCIQIVDLLTRRSAR
jgi:ankyrin repeat protein